MKTLFETETGSVYELDHENSRIRRVSGVQQPTPRVGADGEWRAFVGEPKLKLDHPALIVWRIDVEGGTPIFRSTMTSRVVDIVRLDEQKEAS